MAQSEQLIIDEGYPNWLLVELGMQSLENKRISDAIEFFREALNRERTIPEALYGLGMAYLGTGDYQMAVRELELSLEQSQYLYAPEFEYQIKYSLVDAYRLGGEQKLLQDTLLGIVADDPYFSDEEYLDARKNYRRTLQQQGADALFQLYRLPEIFSRRAHRELGMQYLIYNLPSQAVEHLLFAALMGFSEVIEELIRVLPNYRYTTIMDVYATIFSQDPRLKHLREYLQTDTFTAEMLFLADAFYIEGQNALAQDIWRMIAQLQGPEIIRERARYQLQNPELPDSYSLRMLEDFGPK